LQPCVTTAPKLPVEEVKTLRILNAKPVSRFLKWRVALMELGVRKLKLNEATSRLPFKYPGLSEDPHQMIQVHDYNNVSFFRMDPDIKASTKKTIEVLSTGYPELLAHKYFVNVPGIMGWVFGVVKLFVSPATLRKFHPMGSGTSLVYDLKTLKSSLPAAYGGEGPSLKESAETVKLAATTEAIGDKSAGLGPVKDEATQTPVPTPAVATTTEEKPEEKAETTKVEDEAAKTESKEPVKDDVKEETKEEPKEAVAATPAIQAT
jgi:phosphatidylinositol transfer protein SFH5